MSNLNIDYSKYHRDNEYSDNEKLFKNIFKKRFRLIKLYNKSPKTVLDIGCSNGVFLDLFEGSETWGVEPSENAKKAIAKGHKVINTHFEDANLPQNYFDLVIMNHTLEHVKDANVVLLKINKILKKNGILFIDVPNAGGLSSKMLGDKWPYKLPNEHTYQFTKDSLSEIVEDSGFKILHWESRSGLFETANPLLELWQSLVGLKKRFLTNLLTTPYALLATLLNMGDSMSIIARKN